MIHWTINLKGGPKNSYHAAVVVGHKLYSFGGYSSYLNNRDQIEVHIFNTVSLRWRKLPPVTNGRGQSPIDVPSGRWGHTAVLVEEIVYIWGGYPDCNGIYAFDVDTHSWFKPSISGTFPGARSHHSTCVLEKVIYVYGGRTQLTKDSANEMYKLDTTILVWSLINTRGTPPRTSHRHSAAIIGTKMFVFGGYGGGFYNSIRVFDTETNCWLSMPSGHRLPEERCAHSAFVYNGELYIFGGYGNSNQYFNDLWKFSPETFSWKQVKPKGKDPCRMYGMSCCMVRDCIIISGGLKADHIPVDDLYILDLRPTLKILCKLSVLNYGLKQSELPHDIKWELATMTNNVNRKK